MAVQPIPKGYRSVTPYLIVDGAAEVIEFAVKGLDAEERPRMTMPNGKIGHAEFIVGDSIIMIADATAESPPQPAVIHLYVEDVDKTFARAVEAGAEVVRPVQDEFYGDRLGGVRDVGGNQWWISTHIEDVSPEEMERRVKEMMGSQG